MPTVNFRLSQFNNDPTIDKKIIMRPLYYPYAKNGIIYTGDPVDIPLDNAGSGSVNVNVPNLYQCDLWTNGDGTMKVENTFNLYIPEDTEGSVFAADLITEFTGSFSTSGIFKIVDVPENTGSYGQKGWIAFSTDHIYFYNNGWQTIVLTEF